MTGIICINKGKDITSFGVVAKVRGITREKKAGHTGTLDPMATGVLPIMLGGATRFLNFLPDSDKGYRATFILGKTTDTLDITGNVMSECEVNVKKEDVVALLPKYTGKIKQVPPMFSAKSVDGVRLYDLARKGIEVEREACEVEIKSLELVSSNNNEYVIDVLCSKGTYIRSLIDDIGRDLGCGAVMSELERTQAMGFTLDNAVTIEELQAIKDSEKSFDEVLINLEDMYKDYQRIYVSTAQAKRFSNGGALDVKRLKKAPVTDEICTVYSCDNIFLGLGQSDGNELKVARLLAKRD
jgi:tRNA pseudouridine55 synthase